MLEKMINCLEFDTINETYRDVEKDIYMIGLMRLLRRSRAYENVHVML